MVIGESERTSTSGTPTASFAHRLRLPTMAVGQLQWIIIVGAESGG